MPRVLIVAGSDSGGGAGLQADIKTCTLLGAYAMTTVTAVTAQNTCGVHGIHGIPAAFIARQMRVVLEDIGADCIKIGMVHAESAILAIAEVLADYPALPVLLDPVMIAKGGAPLLQPAAIACLMEHLVPRARLVTPNLPEASVMLNYLGHPMPLTTRAEREAAALHLVQHCPAVLLKGGHQEEDDDLTDLLAERDATTLYSWHAPRQATRHTHGTGCTFAAAIAAGLARGQTLPDAITRAHAFVQHALAHAPGLGQGHGPLGFVTFDATL